MLKKQVSACFATEEKFFMIYRIQETFKNNLFVFVPAFALILLFKQMWNFFARNVLSTKTLNYAGMFGNAAEN